MRNGIITIMKKELARFFSDKRVVFTTILFPGLMIFVLYSFMGDAMSSMYNVDEEYVSQISVVNLPDSVAAMGEQAELVFEEISADEVEGVKEQISDKEYDLCVVFPENFDADVAVYSTAMNTPAPQVEMYYNSARIESNAAYQMLSSMLNQYESVMSNKFDINMAEDGEFDLASDEDITGMAFSSMLPMLLLIFLFSGCMSVGPEAIAGEKERGTIATLLVTPVKRSELAIGKIMALSIIALLSGLSSTVGTLASLPKMMSDASGEVMKNVYTVSDYVMLGVVILTTVLVIITVISIISAFAKSIKEAQTAVTPFMILVMFIGLSAMFGTGAKTEITYYFIPLYNSVQSMLGIFSFEANTTCLAVTAVSNLVYSAVGVFVLAKMFNSEKIIFTK